MFYPIPKISSSVFSDIHVHSYSLFYFLFMVFVGVITQLSVCFPQLYFLLLSSDGLLFKTANLCVFIIVLCSLFQYSRCFLFFLFLIKRENICSGFQPRSLGLKSENHWCNKLYLHKKCVRFFQIHLTFLIYDLIDKSHQVGSGSF